MDVDRRRGAPLNGQEDPGNEQSEHRLPGRQRHEVVAADNGSGTERQHHPEEEPAEPTAMPVGRERTGSTPTTPVMALSTSGCATATIS